MMHALGSAPSFWGRLRLWVPMTLMWGAMAAPTPYEPPPKGIALPKNGCQLSVPQRLSISLQRSSIWDVSRPDLAVQLSIS